MRQYKVPPIPASIWQKPTHFIAFGFGSGVVPFAPGTCGTIMAIPFYLALQSLSVSIYCLITFVIMLASMWICDRVSKEINIHDHQGMCLDEIVGYLVTMINAPRGFIWILIGFILFRLFDIWKPAPIRYIDEKLTGGIGMILDDVAAAFYSWLILQLLAWVFH